MGRVCRGFYQSYYPDFTDARALLQAAIRLGGMRLLFDHHCWSPMLNYLQLASLKRWRDSERLAVCSIADLNHDRLTHWLRQWAREVAMTGQDLKQDGRWEQRFLKKQPQKVKFWGRDDGGGHAFDGHIVGFTYGDTPGAWQIWVATSLDEHAGEFWEFQESAEAADPPLNLPGSWVEPVIEVDYKIFDYQFSHSRRKRKRFLRYLGLTPAHADEVFNPTSLRWRRLADHAQKGKDIGVRRAKFFREIGISSIC